MATLSDHPFSTETLLSGVAFSALSMVLEHRTKNQSIEPLEKSETKLLLKAQQGLVQFEARQDGVRIKLLADRLERLQMLRDGLIDSLEQAMPKLTDALKWSDQDNVDKLPQNLKFTQVLSVAKLGQAFLRVKIKADDLSSYQSDAIHFRLLLPPSGLREVEWPFVKENGATNWPKGDKALHRPVYTARRVNHDEGIMEFDVFVHAGGRVTEWAKSVSSGETLAILGPGGGGIPETDKILAFADETAFPAIARIAETLPNTSSGKIVLMATGGADCDYPIKTPDNIELEWVDSNDCTRLAETALEVQRNHPEHYFWFAAEKSAAQHVRKALKENSAVSKNSYIAGYWNAA